MTRTIRLLVVTAVILGGIPSCAAISVDTLPQPGSSYGDGYDVGIEFANVLNLSDGAKVMLDGVKIGKVSGVTLLGDRVYVRLRIGSGIEVPANARGSLEQSAVLGDIYVALESPPLTERAASLAPSGRIALPDTTSPPQLEDTLARIATVATSGTIGRLQNTIIRLNRVTPPTEEVHRLTSRVVSDLSDLSENLDQVDNLLEEVTSTSDVLKKEIPSLKLMLSPKGQLGFDRSVLWLNYCAEMFPGLGSIYQGGFWLLPLIKSLGDTIGQVRDTKWAFEREVPAWRRLFTDFFLPADRHPAINITSIVGPDGREMSGDVQNVLRILGAMP